MIDDALRLTIDDIFTPVYSFENNIYYKNKMNFFIKVLSLLKDILIVKIYSNLYVVVGKILMIKVIIKLNIINWKLKNIN